MKLVYLPAAYDDLRRLYEFLAPKNPEAAIALLIKLRAAARGLAEIFPERGTPIGRTGLRQLFVPLGRSRYVMRYRIQMKDDTLYVVRIWHGRERRI